MNVGYGGALTSLACKDLPFTGHSSPLDPTITLILEPHHVALAPPLASVLSRADCALSQVSLQTAKSLQAERAAEQCRDLRAVLNLLIHITQSDLSSADGDLSARGLTAVAPPGATPGANPPPTPAAVAAANGDSPISRVVLVGLNIVLPLINAELLKFPKLAQLYYSLLSYMLEVYPRAVAELAPQHFASLMASLEWGLLGSDTVAVHCSLEGLAGLAKFQFEAVKAGARGLAGQSAGEAGGQQGQLLGGGGGGEQLFGVVVWSGV